MPSEWDNPLQHPLEYGPIGWTAEKADEIEADAANASRVKSLKFDIRFASTERRYAPIPSLGAVKGVKHGGIVVAMHGGLHYDAASKSERGVHLP